MSRKIHQKNPIGDTFAVALKLSQNFSLSQAHWKVLYKYRSFASPSSGTEAEVRATVERVIANYIYGAAREVSDTSVRIRLSEAVDHLTKIHILIRDLQYSLRVNKSFKENFVEESDDLFKKYFEFERELQVCLGKLPASKPGQDKDTMIGLISDLYVILVYHSTEGTNKMLVNGAGLRRDFLEFFNCLIPVIAEHASVRVGAHTIKRLLNEVHERKKT